MCFKWSLRFGWGSALKTPSCLSAGEGPGSAAGWWVPSEGDGVCALRACWWGRAFVSGSHCGEESSDVMSPVSEAWAFALVFTVTQLQNKHVSSPHPETTGNLHHVSEYPLGPLIDFYCVLSTASRSLPSLVLQQRSQDWELAVLSLRGISHYEY